MHRQSGVSSVEVVMAFVVFSIIAVVALPALGIGAKPVVNVNENTANSVKKVKSAYAIAIAAQGDFPKLSDVVQYIDADFSSETNDYSGIIFRDGESRLTVNTYVDPDCKYLTSNKEPGITDVVKCM